MQEQASGEVARRNVSAVSVELRRAHPELFAVAEDIIRRAGMYSGRAQAVWFHNSEWYTGPVDGKEFLRRHKASWLAGVYSRASTPLEVVQDMFLTMEQAR